MKKIINLSLVIFLLAGIFSIGFHSAYAKEAKKANNIIATQAVSKTNLKSNPGCSKTVSVGRRATIVLVPCTGKGGKKPRKKHNLAPKSTTELAANAVSI
jgi:hypothetical protein